MIWFNAWVKRKLRQRGVCAVSCSSLRRSHSKFGTSSVWLIGRELELEFPTEFSCCVHRRDSVWLSKGVKLYFLGMEELFLCISTSPKWPWLSGHGHLTFGLTIISPFLELNSLRIPKGSPLSPTFLVISISVLGFLADRGQRASSSC